MFKNTLVRELAITLVAKLFLVWVIWFSFFSQPAEEVEPGDLFSYIVDTAPTGVPSSVVRLPGEV